MSSANVLSMWSPEPGWTPLTGGRGVHTVGLWSGTYQGKSAILKRIGAPSSFDPDSVSTCHDLDYWRREAEILLDGCLADRQGLRAAQALAVLEDETGISLIMPRLEDGNNSGLYLARALGRFAASGLPDRPYWAESHLATRLERVAHRGGWPMLQRTTASDVTVHLWDRRFHHLKALGTQQQAPAHGDPTQANLVGRVGDDVIALDWANTGLAPAGFDVGYLALSVKEDFHALLDAYCDALAPANRDEVTYAAQASAVYTALTRADWALARVADGEGALAGKFRHPSVAPYLRSLERLIPEIEALLAR